MAASQVGGLFDPNQTNGAHVTVTTRPDLVSNATTAAAADEGNHSSGPQTNLSYAVLAAMCLIILAQMTMMMLQKKGWGAVNLKVLGIVIVVMMGTFLIVAGYSQNQISPMIGLLGTLLGYLLGSRGNQQD